MELFFLFGVFFFSNLKKKKGKKGGVRIGSCVSKRGAGRDASASARRLPSQHLTGSLISSSSAVAYGGEPSDPSDIGGAKMKGLFKSKPRTPADLVRQTRDLLLYADRSNSLPDLRESKREEKVFFPFLPLNARSSSLISYLQTLMMIVITIFEST